VITYSYGTEVVISTDVCEFKANGRKHKFGRQMLNRVKKQQIL